MGELVVAGVGADRTIVLFRSVPSLRYKWAMTLGTGVGGSS
jgi:hypothetical protein